MDKVLESAMTWITDSLTKVRPVSFVRKMQISLVIITLVMVTVMLAIPFMGQEAIDLSKDGPFSEGKIAPEKVISTRDIIYIDEEKTEDLKKKAYQNAAFVFDKDYSLLNEKIRPSIDQDMQDLKTLDATGDIQAIIKANPRWKYRTKEELQTLMGYRRKDRLTSILLQYTNLIFSSFCITREKFSNRDALNSAGAKIRNLGTDSETTAIDGKKVIPRGFLYRDRETVIELNRLATEKLPQLDESVLTVVKKLALSYTYGSPACSYNEKETKAQKEKAASKVAPVNAKISAGEVIVKSNEVITPQIKQKLEIVNKYATRANITSILSIFIIQSLFVGIIIAFLKKYNPKRLNDVSSNVIVFSTIWILVICTYIASKFFFDYETKYDSVYYFALFVPIGMVCLILGFIYDEQLSVAIGFYLSFFVFAASRYDATSFTLAFVTSIVGSAYGTRLRKRIDFMKAGFYIAAVQILIASSGYLFDSRNYWVASSSGSFFTDLMDSNSFRLYMLCLINGFVCSTATQFLLPIYEYVFNIPTRFKLLELADTGHPLLQDLLTKAPSTYTHTFMVAALSERACQNLGLDWLLTRVGVYFHDIGKIPNAGFFIENQHLIPKKENIDRNNPAKAAKIVIDHVLDGIEMAKKARLPREVINFIPEHHGTSVMAFFYHKALQELSPSQKKKLTKFDFMYPGPKPQRKETAIVMIADSLEAASRSLDEITPEALDELIQKIINIKLAENQLDESGLTLGDLEVIKASFKEVLLSSLHTRPKYPKPEETKELEQNSKVAVSSKGAKKAKTKSAAGK